MSESAPTTGSFREQMISLTMMRRGCDRAEAEVILDRIADRLDGHTHDEVAEMHPLPHEMRNSDASP